MHSGRHGGDNVDVVTVECSNASTCYRVHHKYGMPPERGLALGNYLLYARQHHLYTPRIDAPGGGGDSV